MSLDDMIPYLSDQTGWQVRIVNLDGEKATLVADGATSVYVQDRIERATRALNALLPAQYRYFILQLREIAMPMSTVVIERDQWVAQRLRAQAPSQQQEKMWAFQGNQGFKPFEDITLPYTSSSFRLIPSYNQILGGPDAFVLYSLGAQLAGDYRFNQDTWVVGAANLRVVDNFDRFKYTAPNNLCVRTYQRDMLPHPPSPCPHCS